MRRILLCYLFCLVFGLCHAQTNSSRSVYLEFVGTSIPVGINYDARFPNSCFGYRVGLAYTIGSMGNMFEDSCMKDEEICGFNVPIEFNCLLGKNRKGVVWN